MAPHTTTGLFQLPSSLLENIFLLLPFSDRASVLPAVCKEAHAFLQRGSTVWREVFVSTDFTDPQDKPRFPCFARWLTQRAAGIRHLELSLLVGWQLDPEFIADLWPHLHSALEAVMPFCEFLKLSWSGTLVVDGWISSATQLTTLALMGDDIAFHVPLCGLPMLRELELGTLNAGGPALPPAWLPVQLERLTLIPAPHHVIPPQVLDLPRLVHLDVSETIFARNTLADALPHLTRLSSLALDETNMELPSQLSLLTALRVLSMDNCGFIAEPLAEPSCPVTGLTRLAALSLSNNQLQKFPATLQHMTSLENLYLENNAFSQLLDGPYLGSLRILSIDWEVLLCSVPQLSRATGLKQLALGRPPGVHVAEDPRQHSAAAVLGMLAAHPSLEEVVVLGGFMGACDVQQLEVLLRIASCKPGLAVRALRRTEFFVADPHDAGGST